MPILKSLDCLSNPSIEKVDLLLTLASFYSNDVKKECLLSEYKLLTHVESVKGKNSIHSVFLHMVEMEYKKILPNLSRSYKLHWHFQSHLHPAFIFCIEICEKQFENNHMSRKTKWFVGNCCWITKIKKYKGCRICQPFLEEVWSQITPFLIK